MLMDTNRPLMAHKSRITCIESRASLQFHFNRLLFRLICTIMRWPRCLYKPLSVYHSTALFILLQFISVSNGFWYYRGRFITSRWTKLFTIIWPICILSLMLSCLQQLFDNPEYSVHIYKRDQFILAICALELLISTGSYMLTICSMLRNASTHVELYDRIDALDQKLMCEFGANLNYHKLLQKNIIQVGILIAVYHAAVSLTMMQAFPNTNRYYVGRLTFVYISITSGLHITCYMHSNFAEMLRIRFRLLQKLLDANYLQKMFPQSSQRVASIRSLVDMVRTLHEIIGPINEVHRVSLMVGVAHDFMTVITVLYLVFGHSMSAHVDYTLFAHGIMWLLLPLQKFITEPVYCGMAVKEGKRCLRLIEQIDIWFPNFKSAKLIVEATMYWRLSNKFEFTCGPNMIYNRTIIAKITAVIFNYLLVLIQFRMTQLMSHQTGEQKTRLQDWVNNN